MLHPKVVALGATAALAAGTGWIASSSTAASAPRVASRPAAAIDPADFVRRVDNPWFPRSRREDAALPRERTASAGATSSRSRAGRGRSSALRRRSSTTASWRTGASRKTRSTTTRRTGTGPSVLRRGHEGARPPRPGDQPRRDLARGRARRPGGIFMPARPRVGQSFRQEFLKGHADDHSGSSACTRPRRSPRSPRAAP